MTLGNPNQGMKAHPEIDRLTLEPDFHYIRGVYPPLGFLGVADAPLGNGDQFGLYWPYGREDRAPMVCDLEHDAKLLLHAFSGVGPFLEWLDANDWERGDVEVADSLAFGTRLAIAKAAVSSAPEQAISVLRGVCDDFPESAEAWFMLAGQLRRTGDAAGAVEAAIRSYTSNWAFGMPPEGCVRMLRGATGRADEPVVERSANLTLKFGGTYENDSYRLMKEIVREYLDAGSVIPALLVNQNYAYAMTSETAAFQQRQGFNLEDWYGEQTDLCRSYLADDRQQVA